jgi:hypothetical protein
MRRTVGPILAGAAVFVAAAAVPWTGLFSGRGIGDMYLFRMYAHRMQDGLLPYRDFYFDWPPGTVPPVLWPVLPPGSYYVWFHVFLALYAIGSLAAVAATLHLLGASQRRLYGGVIAAAAVPFALGSISINSVDYWPALFAGAGLAALVARRDRLGFGLLGFGIVAKVYPVVLVPLAVISVWRRRGRDEALRCLAIAAGVVAIVAAPFAILGHGGLGYSTYTQFKRGLQMESLGASVLMAFDHLGVYTAHVVVGRPYSLDVSGPAAAAVGVLSTLLVVAALLFVYAAYAAGGEDAQRLVTAAAAAVAAYVAFNRVFSPQYLVWLIPLVPLVAGRYGLAAIGLLYGASALTMTWFPGRFWHLVAVSPVSWFVLLRNLLVVLLFAVVVTPLIRSAERPLRELMPSSGGESRRGIARARAR